MSEGKEIDAAAPPPRVTQEMLNAAAQLIGIELMDAQKAMALPGVNRNLAHDETLRQIDVPLDTEPAIASHPAPPGKRFTTKRDRFKLSRVELPPFNTL
ncbi:MAG: hypothetical protein RMK49_13340, partial [Abditibacteriales bacterium]|nr:hypothetical protein [Abditibacteriales bacterium]